MQSSLGAGAFGQVQRLGLYKSWRNYGNIFFKYAMTVYIYIYIEIINKYIYIFINEYGRICIPIGILYHYTVCVYTTVDDKGLA